MDAQAREQILPDSVADLFPGSKNVTYLSTCTRGLLPTTARAAIEQHLDSLEAGTTDKDAVFAAVDRTRAAYAQLIHADKLEIAYTKNVSEGLNIIAASLDWKPGDNVVVCLSMEHPNNVYPWLNLRERHGVEVRKVPDRDGHIDAEAMMAAADSRTRLITIPTVSFSPGFRTDVAAIGAFCRERGIFLLADGVQSVGTLDMDVRAFNIDGLAVSTQKGLCGLYGMGFLYCRREWADRIQPAYLARFSVDLGSSDAHEAALGAEDYKLMPGAGRFDVGNYNFPAVVAAEQSLKILNEVGTQAIEAHVTALSGRLITGLLELGLPVAGGEPGPHTGNIVCIGNMNTDSHSGTDDVRMQAFSEKLAEQKVIHTLRRGMIRLALHLYTSSDDIERVLDIARTCTAAK